MKQEDFSKEIFDKYENASGSMAEILLKDGTLHKGFLVGYYHGDEEAGEPFILKWHFIDKSEIQLHDLSFSYDPDNPELGIIINQDDIQSVNFK